MKYDSKTGLLSFETKYPAIPGCPVSITAKLDLSGMTNSEQQRVIAIAKLVNQFSNGHDIMSEHVVKADPITGKGEVKYPSSLVRTVNILKHKGENRTAEAMTIPV